MFQHVPTIFVLYFLVIQHSFLNMVIEIVDLHSRHGDFQFANCQFNRGPFMTMKSPLMTSNDH